MRGQSLSVAAITGGTITLSQGAVSAAPLSWGSDTNTGFYQNAANSVSFAASGATQYRVLADNFRLRSSVLFGWSSGAPDAAGIDTSFSRQSAGLPVVNGSTATPAGGSSSLGLVFGSTAGFGIYVGSGAPTLSAAQGSIYLRSDGSSTSTRLYVNTNGTTGWTNVTTAT